MIRPMTVLLASGASGGHLFPALAVAEVLRKRGVRCVIVLGGDAFADKVMQAGFELLSLPASPFNVRNPFRKLMAIFRFIWGFGIALKFVWRETPAVVLGTGGYASVATLFAAKVIGTPTLVHEQNVLPGRANKLLSRIVDTVLLTFEESREYVPASVDVKVVGTPLRETVCEAAAAMTAPPQDDLFGLLVLGGSKGSGVISEVVSEMVASMTPREREEVRLVHQCRPSEVNRLQALYERLGVGEVTVQSFFDDLPRYYEKTHVVIGRSGTGTLMETSLFGRAAIYAPHQLADGHQRLNAEVAEHIGAAIVMDAPVFTPKNLLVQVRSLMADPLKVRAMGVAAKNLASPDAAIRVAEALLSAADKDILQDTQL